MGDAAEEIEPTEMGLRAVPDTDNLLAELLEGEGADEDADDEDPGRLAMAIAEELAGPRPRLEVTYLTVLAQVEVRMVAEDGSARVVRAGSFGDCLAVLHSVPDDGEVLDLDADGTWACPCCRGIRVLFDTSSGRTTRVSPGGLAGELKACPECAPGAS